MDGSTETVQTGDSYVLQFHGLPPGSNQVRGANRHKLAKETKQWRELAKLLAQQKGIPALGRARIEATVFRRNLGVADESNDKERFKPIVDGLVDAGVIRNDRRGDIVWAPVKEGHGPVGVQVVLSVIAPGCTRCGSTEDDVLPVADTIHLCLKCYAKLVKWFLSQQACTTVKELLSTWKKG